MYKILRTQVNLRFTNEDVFNNLVEPLKTSRELSGLIVKLLTLYYSNKETHNLVRDMLLDDVLSIKDNDGVSSPVVSGRDMSLKDKTLERKSEDIQLKARINNLENKMNEILSILESNKDSTASESDIVSNIPLEDSSLNKPYQPPTIEKIPEVEDVAITNQEISQVSIIENVLEPQDIAIVNQEDKTIVLVICLQVKSQRFKIVQIILKHLVQQRIRHHQLQAIILQTKKHQLQVILP